MAVVVVFFICWAPFHTQRLYSAYSSLPETPASPSSTSSTAATSSSTSSSSSSEGGGGEDDETLNSRSYTMSVVETVSFYVSGILYYVSSVVNPILYNIMSLKFRQAFKDTIVNCCYCLRSGPSSVSGAGNGLRLTTGGGTTMQRRPWYRTDDTTSKRRTTLNIDRGQRIVYRDVHMTDHRSGNDITSSTVGFEENNDEGVALETGSITRRYRFYGRQSSVPTTGADAYARIQSENNGGTQPSQGHRASRLVSGVSGPAEGEYIGLQPIGCSSPSGVSGTAASNAASIGNEPGEFDINLDCQRSMIGVGRPGVPVAAVSYCRQVSGRSTLHTAPLRDGLGATCGTVDHRGGAMLRFVGWFRPRRRRPSLEANFA